MCKQRLVVLMLVVGFMCLRMVGADEIGKVESIVNSYVRVTVKAVPAGVVGFGIFDE